jgi:hypothetical protein
MEIAKKGISKKRIPRELTGIVRKGKVDNSLDNFFSVKMKNDYHIFTTSDSVLFNSPREGEEVFVSFYGHGRKVYFPYMVSNINASRTFYKKR